MPTVEVMQEIEESEEQTVFKFSELSESAKETAREYWREQESQEFGLFGELWEPALSAAKLLGIDFDYNSHKLHGGKSREEPNIMYSGFCSQGDGASFTGSYDFKSCCAEVRAEFGKDERLWAIADGLTCLHNRLRLLKGENLSGKITQSDSHYVHEMTMDAVVFNSEGDEYDWADPIVKEFLELMRDFARWIYKGLEADYDYRMSDENIDGIMEDNDYEFDEDGDML